MLVGQKTRKTYSYLRVGADILSLSLSLSLSQRPIFLTMREIMLDLNDTGGGINDLCSGSTLCAS